ncbi:hypothetical protein BGX33_008843, partial [Mortierella sp. NVP41]
RSSTSLLSDTTKPTVNNPNNYPYDAQDNNNSNSEECHPSCKHERQLATPTSFWPALDPKHWLQTYEEIARANNWGSKARLDIVCVYLYEGEARTWFRENHGELWNAEGDFEAFKRAFLARFEGQTRDEYVKGVMKTRVVAFVCVMLFFVGLMVFAEKY